MDKVTRLTHKDFNCTEDEYNNLMIDCWKIAKGMKDGVRINVVVGKDEILTFAFIQDQKDIIRLS